jgi:hypothetical protein
MKFESAAGNVFQLNLVGYEQPDVTEDLWDSNWLVVNGTVTAGDRTWRFVSPCVTTFELEELSEWLEGVASEPTELTFAEPTLAFSYAPRPTPVLRIRFAFASAPPWLTEDQRADGETLDFETSRAQAKALAGDLREALADYPTRGGAA